jgi:hypothetical protein
MFSKTIAAGVIALTALTAIPANAGGLTIDFGYGAGPGWSGNGGHGWHNERLAPREVRRILRHKGYHQIRFADRRGSTYEVTARRNGRDFYMVVSAWSGDILSRHRI